MEAEVTTRDIPDASAKKDFEKSISRMRVVVVALLIGVFVLGAAVVYLATRAALNPNNVISVPGSASAEVAALRAQNAEIARSQDTLLSSLLAAFGIAATVIVAFTALGAFLFRYQYDRDLSNFHAFLDIETRSRQHQDSALLTKINQVESRIGELGDRLQRLDGIEKEVDSAKIYISHLMVQVLEDRLSEAPNDRPDKQIQMLLSFLESDVANQPDGFVRERFLRSALRAIKKLHLEKMHSDHVEQLQQQILDRFRDVEDEDLFELKSFISFQDEYERYQVTMDKIWNPE